MRNTQIRKFKISATHIEQKETPKSVLHNKHHKSGEQTEEFLFIRDERSEEEKEKQNRVAEEIHQNNLKLFRIE
jgi:hypothetical protein